MKHLYSWVDPVAGGLRPRGARKLAPQGALAERQLLHRPQRRLHPVRDVARLAPLRLVARRTRKAGTALTARSAGRRAALPFMRLAITFAAFDWLMSLNPTWFSTIFGVYFFAGSFLSALSILAIVTWQANLNNVFGGGMNIEHTHSIGKLMLAFTCFWTYIAFSQLLLIWIAGCPRRRRSTSRASSAGWRGMGVASSCSTSSCRSARCCRARSSGTRSSWRSSRSGSSASTTSTSTGW
jgi:hypothetical protein